MSQALLSKTKGQAVREISQPINHSADRCHSHLKITLATMRVSLTLSAHTRKPAASHPAAGELPEGFATNRHDGVLERVQVYCGLWKTGNGNVSLRWVCPFLSAVRHQLPPYIFSESSTYASARGRDN
jgi:hypothetical protein